MKHKVSLWLGLILVVAVPAYAFYASEGDMQNIFSEGKLEAQNELEEDEGEDGNVGSLSNSTSEVKAIALGDMDSFLAELESLAAQ